VTDQPTCPRPRCGRPIHDQGYVCRTCTDAIGDLLTVVALAAGEEVATIARLDHIARTGGQQDPPLEPWSTAEGALYPTPLPINLDADERFAAADLALYTAALAIEDERGIVMPITGPCRHHTCRLATDRTSRHLGPACPDHARHPLGYVAAFLGQQLEWLRHRPNADTELGAIADACLQLIAVVDRPADRWYAGTCTQCGEDLWPAAGVSTVRCDCGAEYDADERRTAMLERLEEMWLGPEQAAHAMTALGLPVVASTIRTWAERHRLAPHPDSLPGRPRYRVGSVRELVRQMHAEQRHRTLKAAVRTAELAARRAARTKETMSA
jgi:hypothetical protein